MNLYIGMIKLACFLDNWESLVTLISASSIVKLGVEFCVPEETLYAILVVEHSVLDISYQVYTRLHICALHGTRESARVMWSSLLQIDSLFAVMYILYLTFGLSFIQIKHCNSFGFTAPIGCFSFDGEKWLCSNFLGFVHAFEVLQEGYEQVLLSFGYF